MFIYQKCSCTTKPTPKTEKNSYIKVARLMKILSAPNRAHLLSFLSRGAHCVSDLQKHSGLSQTLVSHHLSEFNRNGLVSSQKNIRYVEYSLTPRGRQLVQAMNLCLETSGRAQGEKKLPPKKSMFQRLFGA